MNSLLLKILITFIVFVGAIVAIGRGVLEKPIPKTVSITPMPTRKMPLVRVGENGYYLTLSPSQKEKLQSLVATDNEAKLAYEDIEANAQAALKDTPNPISQIQSSKIVKGDERKSRSLESVKDAEKVYSLGFAYTVTSDMQYAKKAKEFLISWARKNKSSVDPIDQRLLEPMYMGYDLVKPTFTQDERRVVNTWLKVTAQTLIENINPSKSATSNRNNHQSHLLAVVAMIGFSTADQKLIDYVVDGYKKQIQVDLNPDGSSFDFHQRDALYYHVFTLEPLLSVARIAQMNGIDLFDYTTSSVASKAASLQKSIDFLLPYAKGEKNHAEWVHSTAPFDKTRANAGDEQFQPGVLFDPKQAYPTLELYYYFKPDILPLALKLSSTDIKKYPDFFMVYLDAVR